MWNHRRDFRQRFRRPDVVPVVHVVVEPALGRLLQITEQRVEPDRDYRALPVGPVGVGGVQQARIANHHVAGVHRHVEGAVVVAKARVVGIVDAVDVPGVRLADVVQRMAPPVAAGQHPQAAVERAGVLQVVHQEDHRRDGAVGARVLPHHAVLVPVQARAAGKLADDHRLPVRDVGQAHPFQLVQRSRVADDVGQFRPAAGVDQRAGRAGHRQALGILRRHGARRATPRNLQHRLSGHLRDHAEPVPLQLLQPFSRQPGLRTNGSSIRRGQIRHDTSRPTILPAPADAQTHRRLARSGTTALAGCRRGRSRFPCRGIARDGPMRRGGATAAGRIPAPPGPRRNAHRAG